MLIIQMASPTFPKPVPGTLAIAAQRDIYWSSTERSLTWVQTKSLAPLPPAWQ